MSVNTIVVGLDGSDGSARALEWAAELARDTGARIVAVHAVTVPAYALPIAEAPGVGDILDGGWRDDLRQALRDEWCAPIADLPHRAVLADGPPARVIRETADREKADIVVVGRRGRGAVAEMLLGSVSHQLAHHVGRPLVIVPSEG